ncbi:hypothetical protein [Williamsia sp. M5A3_1d]
MSTDRDRPASREFSYARLALAVLGAGTLVLLVSVPVIYAVTRVSAPAALVVALLAVAVAIAVMGLVANRMVDAAARSLESTPQTSSTQATSTQPPPTPSDDEH